MENKKNNTKKITKQNNSTRKSTNTNTKKKTNTNNNSHKKTNSQNNNILPIIFLIALGINVIIAFFFNQDEKWVQNENIISKGSERYEIGDYYDYDESNNGQISGLKDVKWKVLGIDEEGNLLIMSASSIGEIILGDEDNLEKAQQDYLEGSQKINDMTKKYGNGKGAITVRSFTNEDIIKLSNYKDEKTNQEFTFYWSNEENPISKNEKGEIFSIKLPHKNMFVWYNEATKTWTKTEKAGTETNENPVKITTAKKTRFTLDNNIYFTESYRIPVGSKAFNMVYLNDNGEKEMYWTDTTYVDVSQNYIGYGQNVVLYNGLNARTLVYSSGDTNQETAGIRAVVTID